MTLTRRALILRLAQMGGLGAAYEALTALEFIKTPEAAEALALPPDAGRGRRVVILGAGLAGLTAAYELDRAGFDCVILEAGSRAGGRVFTIKRGDRFKEIHETSAQTCTFDEGLYFDAGAARIPHNHGRVIDYCRAFGVALQPHVFASRAGLVHGPFAGGKRTVRLKRVLYDLQGHVAELLAKCTRSPSIDLPVREEDVEALREMLRRMGGLGRTRWGAQDRYMYTNREGRAGFTRPPAGPGEPGVPISPMALEEILGSKVWNSALFADTRPALQASLLEPTGGMDRLIKAFLHQPTRKGGRIEELLRLRSPVRALEIAEDKVTIGYETAGERRSITADYCISTLPAPILQRLDSNLSREFKAALGGLWLMPAGKVAWQAERFWETEHQIFGGISWTTDTIRQIAYPSHGFLQSRGVLTGAYVIGLKAGDFNALAVSQRLAIAKTQGASIHPGLEKRVGNGLAIGWNNMEFARTAWVDATHPEYGRHARLLAEPQGRFHMAGDQLTYLSGWQEGAILSAWNAVQAIAAPGRIRKTP